MERAEAISLLKRHEAELRRLGVEHLYMFGSIARDEASSDSDIDLFFDHAKGQLGVYELMDVKETARAILGRPTDIMTRASLHPALRSGSKQRPYSYSDGGSHAHSAPRQLDAAGR